MQSRRRPTRRWLGLALLPLGSGAALMVHILVPVSLGLALVVTGVIISIAGVLAWKRLPLAMRPEVLRRVRAGLLAGLLATLAYDLSRWVIVTVFHTTFWPFDIFPLFGRAIAGNGVSPDVATAIGVLYHYTNGLFFAVAYAILLAPRGWWTGLFWALGLETIMLALYPGWLHIQAMNEFASVSLLGHLAYGAVLGTVSRWSWARQISGAARLLQAHDVSSTPRTSRTTAST